MTNTEIIVNLATIIADQRLEISELKTEVQHLRHELQAMMVESDDPQTDCVKVGKWYSFTDYGVEMQGDNKPKEFRIVPPTEECNACTVYDSEGNVIAETGCDECPNQNTDCSWR